MSVEVEYIVTRVSKSPGLPESIPAVFHADVDIVIRPESGAADLIRVEVALPFDASMTYAEIERAAISAARFRVDSIRNAPQTPAESPDQQSRPG